jgi:hypothetical protein
VNPSFPTQVHARAAEVVTEFLTGHDVVDAVTIVGSAARRSDANDLDMSALVASEGSVAPIESSVADFLKELPETEALAAVGPFVAVDFHATSGNFGPGPRGWTSGPDEFELDVGNEIAYSLPLWERNRHLAELRERWLPFYDEELRNARLSQARMYAINDLDHIPLMIDRAEPFHAFHRLYFGFQGFLQALFIAHRTYPIAYDKWIREQVEELLGLPELYEELPAIVGVGGLDLDELSHSAQRLRALINEWTVDR